MLCPVWVKKTVKTKVLVRDQNNKYTGQHEIVPQEKTAICGCKATNLVKVHYKDLNRWRQNEGKYEDTFPLCSKHGSNLSTNARRWNIKGDGYRGGLVSGQRGVVERIEVVEADDFDALAREDKNQRVIASIKSNIKRVMGQRNTRNLTLEHWRQVFDETLEEWIVESVQDS